jgi:hypothetical protein
MLWQPPTREISLTRANNRDYIFTFEDMNSPTIPNFSNPPDTRQHSLYVFPSETVFKFRAKDDIYDIAKTGIYDVVKKEVKFSFTAADTVNIRKDRRIPFEMDAIFPDGSRYTILVGHLVVYATQNLNG